jgi:DnaJ-class molecular chaperone
MPKLRKCPWCKGTGLIGLRNHTPLKCPYCSGAGKWKEKIDEKPCFKKENNSV